MTENELIEALAIDIWSAVVVHTEPDWLEENAVPPDAGDWLDLLIETERDSWRKVARKLVETYKQKLVEG